MSGRWAVDVPRASVRHLGRLRCERGVVVQPREDRIWLRGDALNERLERAIRLVPGARRYDLLDRDRLRRFGARVPHGRLPDGEWTGLRAWLALELPPAALPGAETPALPFAMRRTTEESVPGFLELAGRAWLDYADTAPSVRLARWSFAIADDGRALVRGHPVPPLPGRRLVDEHGLARPVGWTWPAGVDAPALRARLALGDGEVAVFDERGAWERVPASGFVRATRSAVRTSIEGETDA